MRCIICGKESHNSKMECVKPKNFKINGSTFKPSLHYFHYDCYLKLAKQRWKEHLTQSNID